MQRLECPACHGFVDEKDSECPECDAELRSQAALPPATGTFVPRMHISAADALPVAVARLERDALPASVAPRRATVALQLARVLTLAVAGWVAVRTGIAWLAYREGYIDSLVPAWNVAVTVGVGFIAHGVWVRRRWAMRWAFSLVVFGALGSLLWATSSGAEWIWIGVVINVSCALALGAARDEFDDGPPDGRNARLGRVLGILALTGSLYVGIAAGTSEPGTERGRTAFAQELQQQFRSGQLGQVEVMASRRTLVITLPGPDELLDQTAAAFRSALDETRNAKVWALGFERIRFTNGTHEALILP